MTRRHFPAEVAGLTETEILRLRTDPDLSRRAAAAFCKESVRYLKERGLNPTFVHLRLAYLLGPADAARIMESGHKTPVVRLLSPAVIRANPFMRRMKVIDLLAKSERDVTWDRSEPATAELTADADIHGNRSAKPRRAASQAKRCNVNLVSCRKLWALSGAKGSKL